MQNGSLPSGDDMVKGFFGPKPGSPTTPSVPGRAPIRSQQMTQPEQQSGAIPPSVYQQLLQMMKGMS